MNILEQPGTPVFLRLVAVGIGVIVFCGLLHRLLKDPQDRRTVWRACMVGLLVSLVLEWTSVGQDGLRWVTKTSVTPERASSMSRTPKPVSQPVTVSVLPVEKPLITQGITPPSLQSQPVAPHASRSVLILPGVWIGVAIVVFAPGFISHLLLVWRHRVKDKLVDGAVAHLAVDIAATLGVRCPRVVWTRDPRAPYVFGFRRATLCLPENFMTTFNQAQQEAILLHEISHVASKDLMWRWFAIMVRALWWWNPLVWWAEQQLRAASEDAADQASLIVSGGPGSLAEGLLVLAREATKERLAGGLRMLEARSSKGLVPRVERLLSLDAASGAGRVLKRRTRWKWIWAFALAVWVGSLSWIPLPLAGAWQVGTRGWDNSLAVQTWVAAHAWLSPSKGKEVVPTPKKSLQTARSILEAKLDSIVIDELMLEGLTLKDAIDQFVAASKRCDPQGKGIEVLIDDPLKSKTGSPATLLLRNPPPIRNMKSRLVLDFLVESTDPRWRYEVSSVAVVVQPPFTEPSIGPRAFMIATNFLTKILASYPPVHESKTPGIEPWIDERLPGWISSLGVSMKGRGVIYRNGMFVVRGTPFEHGLVERGLQKEMERYPHFNLDIVVVEPWTQKSLQSIFGYFPQLQTISDQGVTILTNIQSADVLSWPVRMDGDEMKTLPRLDLETCLPVEVPECFLRSYTQPERYTHRGIPMTTVSGESARYVYSAEKTGLKVREQYLRGGSGLVELFVEVLPEQLSGGRIKLSGFYTSREIVGVSKSAQDLESGGEIVQQRQAWGEIVVADGRTVIAAFPLPEKETRRRVEDLSGSSHPARTIFVLITPRLNYTKMGVGDL